jgi:hypothetical protein
MRAGRRWQALDGPDLDRPDQDYELDGKQQNVWAAETNRIRADLGGVLTRYVLKSVDSKKQPQVR